MQRQKDYSSNDFSSDLTPSFLLPENILKKEQARQERTRPNIIELPHGDETKKHRMVIRNHLYDAVENNHIDLFVQPIVCLPQRKLRFYELFGRLNVKAGNFLPASDYIHLAYEENMITPLDTILLSSGLKHLNKLYTKGQKIAYFVNIKPFTLRNQCFMQELLSYISKNKVLAEHLVFEITAEDFLLLTPDECRVMRALAEIGCRFSIDNAPTLPKDVKSLRAHNINFIKISSDVLAEKGKTTEGFEDLLMRKHNLKINGIQVIVQKIENENMLLDCLDYDVEFGQGYYFGKPDFHCVYN